MRDTIEYTVDAKAFLIPIPDGTYTLTTCDLIVAAFTIQIPGTIYF